MNWEVAGVTKNSFIQLESSDGGSFKAYMAKPEKGSGPGLVLLQEIFGINEYMKSMADHFAEEGYVVLVPDLFWRMEPDVSLGYSEEDFGKAFGFYRNFDVDKAIEDVNSTIRHMRSMDSVAGRVGALGYCLGGKLAYLTAARTDIDCAVSYYGVAIEDALNEGANISCPMVFHFAELDKFAPPEAVEKIRTEFKDRNDFEFYDYPGVDHAFATHGRDSYDKPSAMMAYSRSLSLLRKVLGPIYDLSHLWDMHCHHEFATRDVHATMKTMVAEPYVNHIPTMTGGVGQKHLSRFYKHHFVDANPADTRLVPISRTIGTDRLVDEMLFCFTHDMEIDWMLPGIAPTGKYVEIPLVAIVNFRGDKLYHEHIYWDQASVLVQIGVLDSKGLPVAGRETAAKLVDETLPSNELMANWASSEGKAV
ncbi:MAG: dienelactone hydrolase family protein [Roseovarius sp.]|nr:dienelactone hydrolase family protein [Roseovarius sp.]MCY4316461.1 dienelactone hydrolase family protein [Roseovarius sp.]